MKTYLRKILMLMAFSLVFADAGAQGDKNPITDVVNAVRSNRMQDIEVYLDNYVPVTINNQQAVYSRNQAELVLRDFFEKCPATDLAVQDNGSPDNSSKFCIANFKNSNGRYNIYFLLRASNGRFFIKEFRITKE